MALVIVEEYDVQKFAGTLKRLLEVSDDEN